MRPTHIINANSNSCHDLQDVGCGAGGCQEQVPARGRGAQERASQASGMLASPQAHGMLASPQARGMRACSGQAWQDPQGQTSQEGCIVATGIVVLRKPAPASATSRFASTITIPTSVDGQQG